VRIEVQDGVRSVDARVWNEIVGDGSAFLEWEWLASLEESGCVTARTGWLPQHLTLWEGRDLVGACPVYVKSHSLGEFVFDHGWADAAEQGGIAYYPKLLVAVPFTPATGVRFLARPGADRGEVVAALAEGLKQVCHQSRLSSVHVNFCLPDEIDRLAAAGFERRTGVQYQWHNPGWRTFEDYLGALKTKRRTQIRRERKELDVQGIEIDALVGDAIPDSLLPTMFELYRTTIDKLYWGRQYLNKKLFDLLGKRWKHRLCLIVARRDREVVAGTFNVVKGDVLYGRYWGAFEDVRFLHFNVCYYAAIEYCVTNGIARFEPGAGGEFKHLRGFDATPTDSMHYLADPRLATAVAEYLSRERRAMERHIETLDARSALRK
jgi:predicted N-acyltransferase